jgi:hypothetical protein
MFIYVGARKLLLKAERKRVLTEQWPASKATMQRLGLTFEELLGRDEAKTSSPPKREGR